MRYLILLPLALLLAGCPTQQDIKRLEVQLAEIAARQPDPAAIVANKVGQAGVRSSADSVGTLVGNATASQNFAGTVSTQAKLRALVQQPNDVWEALDLIEISNTNGQDTGQLDAVYERNVDGSVRVVIGKAGAVGSTAILGVSGDIVQQSKDLQDSVRSALAEGAALQAATDNPALVELANRLEIRLKELDNELKKVEQRNATARAGIDAAKSATPGGAASSVASGLLEVR